MDAATSVDHRHSPMPGAIAICLVCSHIMSYDEALQLRELNDKEILDVAGDPDVLRIIKALGMSKKAYEAAYPGKKWGAPKLDS
jgi:hypothetical protein